MRGPKPPPLTLTATQRGILEQLARRHTSTQQLVRRVHIILEADRGANNWQLARLLGLDRGTVSRWRQRWVEAAPRLQAAEAGGSDDRALAALVDEVLADEPRWGAPATFTPEQIVGIVTLACEDPAWSDRPVTHWSPRELAEEAVKRGIVETISPTSGARFLGRGGPQAASGPPVAHQRTGN